MKSKLPNLITSVRFLLALVFFVLLEIYRHGQTPVRILDWAMVIFIVTAVTDILDGYLARRWNKESTFGRILDPLVDKVLVIGAFMYMAGDRFTAADPATGQLTSVTGVATWMVVVILIRELLVTGLRGFGEAKGMSFKATIPGKVKMFVQCVTASLVMLVAGHLAHIPWCRNVRDAMLWLTVVVTLLSMLVYIERARALFSLATPDPKDLSDAGRGGSAA